MNKHLTFKEYVESKEQLKAALKETPIQNTTYVVNKYCKLPLGESKDSKEFVLLKPKHKIVVEWKYEDIMSPDVVSVSFVDVKDVDTGAKSKVLWEKSRFRKWLLKNTREEK